MSTPKTRQSSMSPHQSLVPALTAVLALSTLGTDAMATNGYFPHGYGMAAKGMGGASVAMAQDAFAGANNPAAAAFAGGLAEIGADVFMPTRGMSRTFGPMTVATSNSDRDRFLVPELGYNLPLSNQLGFGLTVYGNGGMNTSYPVESLSCNGGVSTTRANVLCGPGKLGVDLMQLVIAPSLAYQFAPGHAVGVAPLFILQRFSAEGLEAFGAMGFSSNPSALTGRGSDNSRGLGVRLGYQGELAPGVRVGMAYAPKVNMSRFDKYQGLFAGSGDFDIPAHYAVGIALSPAKGWTLAADYQHIAYSGVPSIANASSARALLGMASGPGFGWKDVDAWKVGIQWQATPTLTLRAGYNRGDNPISSNDVTFWYTLTYSISN